MKIQNISFTHYSLNLPQNNKPRQRNLQLNEESYNQPYYKDFNVSFGERLWRSPENFYSCKFNQDNMPETMKQYLEADFEDRQKMPPAQMIKLVFDDVKNAKSLEEVKKLYPDEPLFANIADKPLRKVRTGTLAEIELMREPGKPLFKNGDDNIGLYLIKKIYTEAKTLKEINTDLKNDILGHYDGLEPLDYRDLHAFGIRFPNQSFWKSLTATRKEFPYEYKPRKALLSRSDVKRETKAPVQSVPKTVVKREKAKFRDVKDWEIEKLTNALIKGNGSEKETNKQLKKHGVSNKEALTFVQKYFGEINSVVMEKLDISDDMKRYFESYDDLPKSQQEKFEAYMKNPQMNKLRSKVMSSTIRLFFDVYGADGENDDFKALINYAHSIKTARSAAQFKHDIRQAEYEKIFVQPESVKAEQPSEPLIETKVQSLKETLENIKKDFDVNSYDFETEDGTVTIVSNLREALGESLQAHNKIMPKSFLKRYINFVNTHPSVNESYMLTTLLTEQGIKLPKDDRLISADTADDITLSLYQEFTEKYPVESKAAQQAVTDAFIKLTKDEITPDVFRLGIFEFADLYKNCDSKAQNFLKEQSELVNLKYEEYKRPLTTSEINKITITITDLLRKYNADNTIIKDPSPFKGFENVFQALKFILTNNKTQKDNFKQNLSTYLKEYGGSARFLLDKNMPERLKMAKMEQLLCIYGYDKPGILFSYVAIDSDAMEYLKNNNYKIYDFLKNDVLLNYKTWLK